MTRNFGLLVTGVETTADRLTVSAPFDEAEIATIAAADAAVVEQALSTAYKLYRDRKRWLSPARRIEILQNLVRLMTGKIEHLSIEAAREGGKPYADSKVEVIRAIDSIQICIDCLRSGGGHEIPMDINAASHQHLALTRHEPVGVVVAVSAFNHPVNLIAHQVGPAIAAGCPVIVKPAEDTPLSCYNLVQMLHEAGLPPEWCQALVVKDINLASALVTDARVGFFSFIGSARVGWMLRSQLAPGVRCALEHGGAAPVIVAADADLDQALPRLAKGGMYHAGQVCVSVQRVYCHESIAADVARQLAALSEKMIVDDPLLPNTDIGPLIRPTEVVRVGEWVEQAIAAGAECLCGGQAVSETCYEPTVLYNPPDDAKVSSQEIFGPVICVYPYSDIQDAFDQANALPFSFQASVFTRDIDTAMLAYRHLDASAVMVNEHTAFRVDWMPFAGLKQSGLGVGGIPYTYHDMQIDKMLVLNSPSL